MPKTKSKKRFIRLIHIQAVAVSVIYFFISNSIFVGSIASSNSYISFLVPFFFGLISTFVFLYLFNHKDFFHFMGKFEKEEKSKEKGYLAKFSKYGKYIACVLIAIVGGPIFLALTIRFLFAESENRYRVAFISNLVSTLIMVAFAKGLFNFIFRI